MRSEFVTCEFYDFLSSFGNSHACLFISCRDNRNDHSKRPAPEHDALPFLRGRRSYWTHAPLLGRRPRRETRLRILEGSHSSTQQVIFTYSLHVTRKIKYPSLLVYYDVCCLLRKYISIHNKKNSILYIYRIENLGLSKIFYDLVSTTTNDFYGLSVYYFINLPPFVLSSRKR